MSNAKISIRFVAAGGSVLKRRGNSSADPPSGFPKQKARVNVYNAFALSWHSCSTIVKDF